MSRASRDLLVLLFPGLLAWGTALADVFVIAHKDSPLQELSPSQVSDLYLGRLRSLPGGDAVLVTERERDSRLRERFFHELNGMSLKQLNAYWARLQFSGRVLPPRSYDDTEALLATIRANRMAIGYVDAAEVDDSVRVILRLQESPSHDSSSKQ